MKFLNRHDELARLEGLPARKTGGLAVLVGRPTAFGFGGATTRDDGSFELGLLDGQVVDVECEAAATTGSEPESSRLRARALGVRAGITGLVIVARVPEAVASLAVRLVSWCGDPIAGATVSSRLGATDGPVVGTTDSSGRTRLERLLRWPQTIEVRPADGGADAPVHRFEHLEPDGSEIELRLRPSARTEMMGRVVDALGRPVAQASCSAWSGHEWLASFATDAEGRFSTVVQVPRGTRVQLTSRYPSSEPTARGVESGVFAGLIEPTIRLEEVGTLEAPARQNWLPRVGPIGGTGSQ